MEIRCIISSVNNVYQYKTLQAVAGAYWQGDYSYLVGSDNVPSLA